MLLYSLPDWYRIFDKNTRAKIASSTALLSPFETFPGTCQSCSLRVVSPADTVMALVFPQVTLHWKGKGYFLFVSSQKHGMGRVSLIHFIFLLLVCLLKFFVIFCIFFAQVCCLSAFSKNVNELIFFLRLFSLSHSPLLCLSFFMHPLSFFPMCATAVAHTYLFFERRRTTWMLPFSFF